LDDREVLKKISRGDADAFDAFYRGNALRLQSFLTQIVGSRQTAEDLTHESFMQIWNRPNGFELEHGSLRAYLFGIGRKRAMDWWRSQHPSEPLVDKATEACRAELRSIIGEALGKLPEEQRTLLWLREVEGQSYEELAEILVIPVGTVRSRLFAAREALRKIWHGEGRSL
jgi:RNA polymerase sigma-70 factor, ECF subfamily